MFCDGNSCLFVIGRQAVADDDNDLYTLIAVLNHLDELNICTSVVSKPSEGGVADGIFASFW